MAICLVVTGVLLPRPRGKVAFTQYRSTHDVIAGDRNTLIRVNGMLHTDLWVTGSAKWTKACKVVSVALLAGGVLIALLALTSGYGTPRITGMVRSWHEDQWAAMHGRNIHP